MKASIWEFEPSGEEPVAGLSLRAGNRCSPPWGEEAGSGVVRPAGECLAGWSGPGGVRGARRSRPAGVGGAGRWGALRLVAAPRCIATEAWGDLRDAVDPAPGVGGSARLWPGSPPAGCGGRGCWWRWSRLAARGTLLPGGSARRPATRPCRLPCSSGPC